MQQQKTHMINEEWNKMQNDAPFVAFYSMHAVTFVLPGEMADMSIADCSGLFLYPLEQELPSLLQSYELWGKQPSSLILVTSYDMPLRKAAVLFYIQ